MVHDLSTATEASVAEATEEAILAAEALVALAVTNTGTGFAERIQPLDQAMEHIQDAHGYGPLLANFHPDEAVRNAGNAAQQALATWATDLISRTEVFDAVSAVDIDALEGLERRSADEWIRDLRRAGHGLDRTGRERVRTLQERLITLQVQFAKNIADHEDHLDVPRSDLDALPDAYVDSLGAGDAPGTVRVTLDYPAYVPFMEQSPHRDQRRELQYRYLNRAV
jgi:Zn-dependent oligopeptidase